MKETTLTRAELNERPLLHRNLAALKAGGQDLTLEWLAGARGSRQVTEVEEEGGPPVLVIGGQSQASRRDPRGEAAKWLERTRAGLDHPGGLILYGLGSPWPAEVLLEAAGGRLAVFEPDPLTALAVLSRHDFSARLARGRAGLTLLTPWHTADGRLGDLTKALLLIHPPAQRRRPAPLAGLRAALSKTAGPPLAGLSGRRRPRLMIIPPLSGGSLPVAVSLARAAEAGGFEFRFLDWDQDLTRLEAAAHQSGPADAARLTARLFESAAPTAARAAGEFQPDLMVALAQAPLDAPALSRLREAAAAPLAFWLVEDYRQFDYVAEVAPAYDHLFHIQEGVIEPTLRDWGLTRAHYLPLAADAELFRPLASPDEAGVYQADLSFMGAGYPNRRRLMSFLAENYWPGTGRPTEGFRIFGSGWQGVSRSVRPHLFEDGRRVSLPECALIFGGGRVNLNIHSSGATNPVFNPDSAFVNPRTFEIAAAGGLQLVDPRPLMDGLFSPGRELAVAETMETLPELIDHYLARPEEGAAIGAAARERVLAEHTYAHRLTRLLGCLGWED